MIVADTSGLLALFNRREPEHQVVAATIKAFPGPVVVSPYVVAEVDYLVASRVGVDEEIAVLREFASGAYLLASLDAADIRCAIDVIEQYRDQQIGIADASLVVLADRYATQDILTLDHRHFDVLRARSGGRFSIHP